MGLNKTHEMPPPGASLPIIDVEKAASEDARTRLTRPEDQRLPSNTTDNNKMTSSRRALLSVTLCLLFFFGLTSARPSRWQQRVQCHEGAASAEGENFQSMVDAASPDSLHIILHKTFPGRFQHGVWESEKQAIEAVRRDNAPLATAILRMAKRDDSNTTIASSTQQPTQQPTPSSASSSAQVTSSSSSAAQVTSSSSSAPAPEPSTTTQAPPVITTTSTTSTKSTSSSVPQASPSSTGTSVGESERTLVPLSTSSSASSVSSSEPSSEAGVSSTTSSSSVSSTTLTTTSKAKPQTTEQPQTTQQPQQPDEPMTPSSKVIVQTLTSTSDGVEIVVTQTSTVRVDPTPTVGAATTRASPSLQNAGSSIQQQRGAGRWLMVVEAVVLGALLIFFVLA
ncbi:hypothetical protein B0H65DRAFT_104721 [Neurospora tetraspora]|uniref:Uncharacterized protein n=1 Tax=Neurospora tetraspora TaxID=94610 RepID=A0AAE0MUH2_9PEZI|nr:hypothetical protein B0H65DRAFT_104721 [Neurospora tetraspora]